MVIVIVLVVTGFAVFRSIQIKRKNQEAEIEVGLRNTLNVSPNPDRIFTKRPRFSEPERETEEAPLGNVEDDIVVEDIEMVNTEITVVNRDLDENHETRLGNVEIGQMKKRNILSFQTPLENVEDVIETPHSMDQLSIRRMIQSMENMTEYQQNEIPCLPGIAIIQTLNKYLKNALISLLILTSELPWYLMGLYAFISNSGCENADFRIMAEISFLYQCISYLFLPILIKKKLDRLSE